MQRSKQTLVLIGVAVGLLGCHAFYWPPRDSDPATAVITPTPTAYDSGCAWMWATQDLPDVSAQFTAALDASEIPYSGAGASAFGENCLDSLDGVRYFAAMQTEFGAILPVENAANREAIGDLTADVLAIIVNNFPVESTPGPNPGMITLSFEGSSTAFVVNVWQQIAETVVAQGLRGAALLDELGL